MDTYRHIRLRVRNLLLAIAAVGLAGCESSTLTDGLPEGCGPENLLVNPGFMTEEGPSLESWKGSQHAGEPSFDVSVGDGVVNVERIGTQPWYSLVQFVPVEPLQGQHLLFRTELKLSLSDEGFKPAMDPGGGVQVTVWGAPNPLVGSTRIVYRSDMEQEPRLGEADWFLVDTPFQVAEDASRISVGYHQRASGSMAFRNPGLFKCQAPVSADGQNAEAPEQG